ncbi:TolC family protein [Lutibacter citreus]|uniref:TolC family protein n=1 Tax=Lutibacter citreus TaxID=2138210 RepID=UPI000DBE098E|nr:TolC family protein [Lutibacter citreus]
MTKKINHTLFLCVLMLAISIKVQSQETLSLNECKKQALKHNQTVKVKQASFTSSEASLKLAKRASLPNADFEISYLYANDPMQMNIPGFELPNLDGTPSGVYSPAALTNLQYKNSYNANVGVALPIYMGGKLAQARKIAVKSMAISKSEIALSKTEVLLNIEEQYWTLVSLIETQELSIKSISFLSDVVTDVTNFYESGIVTKNEVLKAQVELNNAKLSDISLRNNIEMLKMAINQSIGKEINSPLQIEDKEIDEYMKMDLINSQNISIDNREEIQVLSNMTKIYESENKIVNADYKPQLTAFGNYYLQNPNHLSQQEDELTFNTGVSLSIPVFHWGEKSLKNKQAQIKVSNAEFLLDQTKELLTLEIHQSIFKLKEAMTKLHFTIEALRQAEENLNLETNRLKEQVSTTTDLLNAQVQWQKAKVDYISAKASVKISEATYSKAIGNLNP